MYWQFCHKPIKLCNSYSRNKVLKLKSNLKTQAKNPSLNLKFIANYPNMSQPLIVISVTSKTSMEILSLTSFRDKIYCKTNALQELTNKKLITHIEIVLIRCRRMSYLLLPHFRRLSTYSLQNSALSFCLAFVDIWVKTSVDEMSRMLRMNNRRIVVT